MVDDTEGIFVWNGRRVISTQIKLNEWELVEKCKKFNCEETKQ